MTFFSEGDKEAQFLQVLPNLTWDADSQMYREFGMTGEKELPKEEVAD